MLAATKTQGIKRSFSVWKDVAMGPKDPILGVTENFMADGSPNKLNLGVGAYRDAEGNPYVLPSVVSAQEQIIAGNMEYGSFTNEATKLAYGQNSAALDGNLASLQSLSGTGALRIAAAFLEKHYTPGAKAYFPNPTWGNHFPIFEHAGVSTGTYRYFDSNTLGLDLDGMLEDIRSLPSGQIILMHACAHNPTGVDPTQDQWKKIHEVVAEKNHFPLFDMAYQGFATGDIEKDAFAPRYFVEQGMPIALCQSFAKNMGLYGHRTGCFSMVCDGADEVARVESQLKILARPIYSNPPIHGARIAELVLRDPVLRPQWEGEVKGMADRIIQLRASLKENLIKNGSKLNWDHVTSQIGMFCYSGLTAKQVDMLADEHHIYMTRNGRISLAGMKLHETDILAKAMVQVQGTG